MFRWFGPNLQWSRNKIPDGIPKSSRGESVGPRKKNTDPTETVATPDYIGGKLKKLRGERGVTRGAIADRLGIDQTAISHTERRQNLMYSTLAAYIEALGGTLHVAATFPDSPPIVLMGDASWRPAVRKEPEPHK